MATWLTATSGWTTSTRSRTARASCVYAVENGGYPGGVNYRSAYFDPRTGENLLRHDNSRRPRHGVGVHHRHRGTDVTATTFDGLQVHVSRFWREVIELRAD